jgi:glyoxylase-like metal-dependent hydrolase (beta-lactamase superfamily II)
MAIGDVYEVTAASRVPIHYVDTGMYDTAEYGAVYVLDAERPAIVDTGIGTNYQRILDAMYHVGIEPADLEHIALTHVHLDHAGGAGFIADACPNATVHVHEIGAPHMVDPDRLVEGTKRAVGDRWEFYTEPEPVPEDRIRELADGDEIDLGNHRLRAHDTPGHAPHQVVFEGVGDRTVFVADAAGIYVPASDEVTATSPPSNFDLEQCLADVATIRDLDPGILCYAHFGATRTRDNLRAYVNTLSEWVASVAEKRAELADDDAVVEHFADRAEFVDVWGERMARRETAINTRGALQYLDQRDSERTEPDDE